jgi:hypothetical protein
MTPKGLPIKLRAGFSLKPTCLKIVNDQMQCKMKWDDGMHFTDLSGAI